MADNTDYRRCLECCRWRSPRPARDALRAAELRAAGPSPDGYGRGRRRRHLPPLLGRSVETIILTSKYLYFTGCLCLFRNKRFESLCLSVCPSRVLWRLSVVRNDRTKLILIEDIIKWITLRQLCSWLGLKILTWLRSLT